MSVRRSDEGLSDTERMRIRRDPTVPWPYEESWPALLGKDACPMCGGAGKVWEQIDDDRFPEPVPCDHCRGKRWKK